MAPTAKDTIRKMHQGGRRPELLDALGRELADTLIDAGIGRSCLNCDLWADNRFSHHGSDHPTEPNGEYCSLANMKPPLKVIVCGCEKHTDLIPF